MLGGAIDDPVRRADGAHLRREVHDRPARRRAPAILLDRAAATGNLALGTLARRVHAALLAARYPLARPAYRRERAMPEHQAIHDAVVAGRPKAARSAMAAHLETVQQYLEQHARSLARRR